MQNKEKFVKRVLGIDPGYARLGLAILDVGPNKHHLIHSECFVPPVGNFSGVLHIIQNKILSITKDYSPGSAAIEDLFFAKNQKTALKVAEVRGCILASLASQNIEIFEYRPNAVKIAVTGYGASTKKDIMSLIPKQIDMGGKNKNSSIILDDEYDAIALALTHLVTMPVYRKIV